MVRRALGDLRRTAIMGASEGGSWFGFEMGTLGSGTGERGTLGGGTGEGETSIGTLGRRVESTINRGSSVSGVGATGRGDGSRIGTGGG